MQIEKVQLEETRFCRTQACQEVLSGGIMQNAEFQMEEKETLVSRSGDNYFFLTNEERDINKEIKQVDLSGGETGDVCRARDAMASSG